MKELWLDAKQVQGLTGWPERTLRHKAKQNIVKWRNKVDSARGRNGRAVREYAASSLPAQSQLLLAQGRLAAPVAKEESLALLPDAGSHDTQISLFVLPPKISDEQRLALSPAQNKEAQRRLEIISPLLEFKRRTNGHKPVIRLQDGREIRNLDSLASYVATQHQVSRASVWRWYGRFQEKGYAALSDDVRADKGQSRFFTHHPELAEFVQSKYLAERLSIRLTHEALVRECGDKLDAPHYDTVRTYLDSLPRPFSILAREGEAEFHNRCAPFLITDFRTVAVNQIWVSDHMKHDVWVRNDCFSGLQPNAAIRPWLTAIIDMRSRKAIGTVWNATPSSNTISSALRQGIGSFGIPDTFYIDNGKDYEAVGKIDLSPEASGVLARLGIRSQYCIPKHPQSKLIESWFATVHKRFDSIWSPFYCSGSIDTRPEICDEMLKEHRQMMKQGKAHHSPLPAASEFIAMAKQWMEEYNTLHVHNGRGMDGRAPDEVFDEELPIVERRVPNDAHSLDALFWSRERRRVLEGGCVQINNARYQPADENSTANLFLMVERDILIACDPTNLGEALALDLDGHYIGRLQAQKLIARGPISRDDVRAGMRQQRLVKRVVNDYINFIAQGRETELDHLRKRAGIPEVIDLQEFETIPNRPKLPKAVGAESAHIEDIAQKFLEGSE